MTAEVIGSTAVVPFSPTANPSHPAACVLPDDTVLIAWQSFDTEIVTLTHYSRNLDAILGSTTVLAPYGVRTEDYRAAVLVHAGSTIRLVYGAGLSWIITTDPLTATPGPAVPEIAWATIGASSTVTTATGTHFAVGASVVTVSESGVTTMPAPNTVVNLYAPPDGGPLVVAVANYSAERVDLYRLDGGLVETGPVQVTPTYPGVALPGVYVGMEWPGEGGEHLVARDPSGTALAGGDWPTGTPQVEGFAGSITTPDGGLLTVWPHRDIADGSGGLGLVNIGLDGSLAITDLSVPVTAGYRSTGWSTAPVLASNGRTAVIVRTAMQDLATKTYGITAWTIDLGTTGLLTVDTLDIPWWTVGTRNPNMAYELLVDTPLGWKVEIVAGEERLATDELCVYDPMHDQAGEDGWVVCALMRPE